MTSKVTADQQCEIALALARERWESLFPVKEEAANLASWDPPYFVREELFLIERDTRPEQTAWREECSARDVWMPQIATSIFVERAASVWVAETQPPSRYGLLDVTRCTVRRLELTHSGFGSVTFVAGTRALYMTMTPSTGRQQWLVFDTLPGLFIGIAVSLLLLLYRASRPNVAGLQLA